MSRLAAALLIAVAAAGCGKKGPPLAPLSMAPEAPQALTARRLGDTIYLEFKVPSKSAAGPGPYSVDRLTVYAVTLAPGTVTPANRVMLKPDHAVGQIEVRPPVDPDAPEEDASDKRPRPGDVVTFVENIGAPQLTPMEVPVVPQGKSKSAPPPAPVSPAAAPAPAAPAGSAVLTRVYVVQGVAKNGNKGAASARASVPLLAPPAPARPGQASYDATSVTVTWNPPLTTSDETPGVAYNVYAVPPGTTAAAAATAAAPAPLNDAPLNTTSFTHAGAEADKEQCFVVRSVATIETATIESAPSDPICVTPRDTFPPAPPKGLAAVSGTGAINLIWDASTDADLGGYLVLRGESPGDTLQPLTPQPIKETRYRDTSVTAGVRYVYAVIAIDRATPPNRSAPSNKVEEIAR